jgi:hypothetical protein
MTNEAVLIRAADRPAHIFTVAEATTIEKGTILKLSGDNTAIATAADGDVVAGIAAAEKVGGDGSTTLAVDTPGCGAVYDCTCGAQTVTLGVMLRVSGANLVTGAAATDAEAGKMLGQALEAGSASEVITVRL